MAEPAMAVVVPAAVPDALLDTQRAFDGVADSYDQSNEANALIRAMRARTMAAVIGAVPAGGHVLDLGCGPGRDATALGALGYRVTAIDWSPAMIGRTAQRVAAAGLEARVMVQHLGIQQLDRLTTGPLDGAYSDLGPLNCVPDLGATAHALARHLRPGGVLVASVIGRVCPWELALYAARRDWRRASIRFTRGLTAVPLEGGQVWTRYLTPSEFEAPFRAAGFVRVSLRALALAVPPPYLDAFAGRHPRLLSLLQRADDTIGGWPVCRQWGDHFLIVLRKRP
jgi:SAM-dependent methyltransferase